MNLNKRCIVNFFSQGRENYKYGSERLISSVLQHKVDTDVHVFSPDFVVNASQVHDICTVYMHKGYPTTSKFGECKTHKEEPYQFKSFAIQYLRELGYEQILWCDSSIVLFKNPEHYFELAKEIGVVLFDNPACPEAVWTSDDCLQQMGCDPEYAKTFFECDAGIMLFDFTIPKAVTIFDEYIGYCMDGICLNGRSKSTRPEFRDHRHDQSIISYIAKKHYVNFLNFGTWCYANNLNEFKPTFAKVGMAQ